MAIIWWELALVGKWFEHKWSKPLPPAVSQATDTTTPLPPDVSSFTTYQDNCDTPTGEITEPDPADPDSLSQVISAINQACKGTDKRLQHLKNKYATDENIMKKLSSYEERIEADMSL